MVHSQDLEAAHNLEVAHILEVHAHNLAQVEAHTQAVVLHNQAVEVHTLAVEHHNLDNLVLVVHLVEVHSQVAEHLQGLVVGHSLEVGHHNLVVVHHNLVVGHRSPEVVPIHSQLAVERRNWEVVHRCANLNLAEHHGWEVVHRGVVEVHHIRGEVVDDLDAALHLVVLHAVEGYHEVVHYCEEASHHDREAVGHGLHPEEVVLPHTLIYVDCDCGYEKPYSAEPHAGGHNYLLEELHDAGSETSLDLGAPLGCEASHKTQSLSLDRGP